MSEARMAAMTGPVRGPRFGFRLFVALVMIACTAPNFAAASQYGVSPSSLALAAETATKYFHFNIQAADYSVNCYNKSMLTVNGEFPGPTIHVTEGDRVIVNVTNMSPSNITIHFHGVRQRRTPWMDGVPYVTMCPIQTGDYFVHNFTVPNQRGTLLWHAHISWQRATLHGAFITTPVTPWRDIEVLGIMANPLLGTPPNSLYPYPVPDGEFPVIIAEWWNDDVEEVEYVGLQTGTAFAESDAVIINGHPGPLYNCSTRANTPSGSKTEGISTLTVQHGKTYLLRIINACLNSHMFFAVANHSVTVVEADGEYVKGYTTSLVFLSPGQTLGVILKASQTSGTFSMAANGYGRDATPPQSNLRPIALLVYGTNGPNLSQNFLATLPFLPNYTEIDYVTNFTQALRTLYPGRVPLEVNKEIFMTVGLSRTYCNTPPIISSCNALNPVLRAQGETNNITFKPPTTSILEASYFNIPGVFTEDFPEHALRYNYTGTAPPAAQTISEYSTRVIGIEYNATVQIILQNTPVLKFENHPFHMHGHNFFQMGEGFGNYDPKTADLNFYDPVLRNTVAVPAGGWAAIRFKANNPGIWLFHCHLEKHTSWGMEMVFHVHNTWGQCGKPNSYACPPDRLVPC